MSLPSLHTFRRVASLFALLMIVGGHVRAEAIFSDATPTASGEVLTLTPTQQAQIAALLTESWQHGLNPSRYHADEIVENLGMVPEDRRVDFADLLTNAIIDYALDLSGMRVNAASIGLRAKDWRQPIKRDAMRAIIKTASDPVVYLKSLPPQTPIYQALMAELVTLRDQLKAGQGNKSITPFTLKKGSVVHPRDRHPDIQLLRERLGTPLPNGGFPDQYDDHLSRAVMLFQRQHGLKDDGVIGPDTLGFFNQTYRERAAQIIANLERLRWDLPLTDKRTIVVNIPAATLWAIEDGQVQIEMPVLVGRAERATKSFRARVNGVRLNPTWTAPETIVKEDLLPALRKNDRILKDKGLELWQRDTNVTDPNANNAWVKIDPTGVEWAKVKENELYKYRFVQPAGPGNVLGRVRVLMPNEYDIYLHDTNTPDYFRSDDRDVSSGCIRLSRPLDLARFILRARKNWTEEQLQEILGHPDKTRDVMLTDPFPVVLLYQTAWLSPKGELVLAYDMYNNDVTLISALGQSDQLPEFMR